MRNATNPVRREAPDDTAKLERAVQRLTTTARTKGLSVAGDFLAALQDALVAQRLGAVAEK